MISFFEAFLNLGWSTWKSSSHSVIAKALGTTTDGHIPPYLNANQTRFTYVISTNPDETAFSSFDGPTVIRLKFSKAGNWTYKTNDIL